MSNSFITSAFFILFGFFSFSLIGSKPKISKPDSTVCLEVSGKILNINKGMDRLYKVELISANYIIKRLILKNKEQFKFNLKKNTHYAIRITKKGFMPRLISIYTTVPADIVRIFRFQFDTELITKAESKKLEPDVLDFPIAVVSFDNEMNCFYYNEDYTSDLKRELYLNKKTWLSNKF